MRSAEAKSGASSGAQPAMATDTPRPSRRRRHGGPGGLRYRRLRQGLAGAGPGGFHHRGDGPANPRRRGGLPRAVGRPGGGRQRGIFFPHISQNTASESVSRAQMGHLLRSSSCWPFCCWLPGRGDMSSWAESCRSCPGSSRRTSPPLPRTGIGTASARSSAFVSKSAVYACWASSSFLDDGFSSRGVWKN